MALQNHVHDSRDSAVEKLPDGTCYSYTGLMSPFNDYTYTPCNLTAVAEGKHSACCNENDICLTNGLCRYNPSKPAPRPFNFYWRIGCTDPTYKDPACPKQCTNMERVERHVHIVFECPGEGNWCCGTGPHTAYKDLGSVNTTCCNNPDLKFKEEAVRYTTIGKLSDFKPATLVAAQASLRGDLISTTLSVSSEATTTASGIASMTTDSMAELVAESTASGTSVSSPSFSKGTSLGIALGLAIPLFICFVFLVGVLIHRRRANDKHERLTELNNDHGGDGQSYGLVAEKYGRELPVELSAVRKPAEMWSPREEGKGWNGDWDREREEGKGVDHGMAWGSDGYR